MDTPPPHTPNSNKGIRPKYCIYITGFLVGVLTLLNVFSSGLSVPRVSVRLDAWWWFQQQQTQPSSTARELRSELHAIMPTTIGDKPSMDEQKEKGNSSELVVLPTDRIMSSHPDDWDRSPIVIEEFRLIFFSIPKVACTTWKQLFRRIMGAPDWESQDLQLILPHNPQVNNLTYLHHYKHNLTYVQEIFVNPNWTKAIFVRDPKQRFLSAYLDKAVSNDGLFVRDKCCAPIPKARSKCMSTPTCRTCLEDGRRNLSSFLQLIHTCKDDHWELQSARMDSKYWKYINFVGNMDTLAEDGIRLMERIGAWEKYGKDGWGTHGNGSMFTTARQKQTHTTNANSKMQTYYYPELEKQVEDFYQEDYDNPLFGFAKTKVTL